MTWALVTGAATEDYQRLLDISRPTHQRYAETFGMEYIEHSSSMRGGYNAAWYKLPALVSALAEHDGALWMDSDAMFCRYDTFIGDAVTHPWNWVVNRCDMGNLIWLIPCTGVLAVTRDAAPILLAIWELREKYRDHNWCEQAGAHEVLGWDSSVAGAERTWETEFTPLVGELGAEWNSLTISVAPDAIVFHAAGLPLCDRMALMTAAA